jgi:hypothetical protein
VQQAGQAGTPEQIREARDILADARKRIFAILAQD